MELLNAFHTSQVPGNKNINQWLDASLKEKYQYKKRVSHSDEAYVIEFLRGRSIDVLSPCATRYAITAKVIDSLAAQFNNLLIVAGANNVFDSPVTQADSVAKNIYCFPEWISNCGNALLYEELLSLPQLPQDYVTHLQDAIGKGIHSFVNEAMPEANTPAHWRETFIRTAENRWSAGTKSVRDQEEISNKKNLTLAV